MKTKMMLVVFASIIASVMLYACSNQTNEGGSSNSVENDMPFSDEEKEHEDASSDNIKDYEEPMNIKETEEVIDDTNQSLESITFQNASVHDPSIIYADGMFYVYGSHLAAAKSEDLVNWTMIGSGVIDTNPLIPNVTQEMKEALAWGQTDTFWAGDVIQLNDGKYYFYYSVCKGDSPRAAIGLAVSDSPEGPFKNVGILLKSGMWGQESEDGTIYDATKHPNAIDPHVFFDKEGKLWMVYGSYSGGIYILEMDAVTGYPLEGQGYGKKLLGNNHVRIEGPYIQYSPQTDYYYLFLSFGGLDANGGYNIRVARSKQPDGPYVDTLDQNLIDAQGPANSFFDDHAIEPYGAKLVGNFLFRRQLGESGGGIGSGYVSPGHNSTYYVEETEQYFNIFHTRFPYRGEDHEIRVHQMFLNEDGWFVMAPHRYSGEVIREYAVDEIVGSYKLVNHGKDISKDIKQSIIVHLNTDGSISGDAVGKWELKDEYTATIELDSKVYKGVFLEQYDELTKQQVMTFTALSTEGISVWATAVTQKE